MCRLADPCDFAVPWLKCMHDQAVSSAGMCFPCDVLSTGWDSEQCQHSGYACTSKLLLNLTLVIPLYVWLSGYVAVRL
jgi:hypothetical protein